MPGLNARVCGLRWREYPNASCVVFAFFLSCCGSFFLPFSDVSTEPKPMRCFWPHAGVGQRGRGRAEGGLSTLLAAMEKRK